MNQKDLLGVLNSNRGVEFVDRMINWRRYPVLKNRNGSVSRVDLDIADERFVFPKVVIDDGEIKRLGYQSAWGRAKLVGDFIEFGSGQEAWSFVLNYKKYMPLFDGTTRGEVFGSPTDVRGDSM